MMIDSLTRHDAKGMSIRVGTSITTAFINFYIVKIFNLTLLAMTLNCSPLITVVFAALILREKISISSVVYLLLAFGAVMIMIAGMK